MSALVFIEETPMVGRVVHPEDGLTIGRERCDIVLPDPEVSRRHAMIRDRELGTSVEDLGSTNGTFVNGELVDGLIVLTTGDEVRFGNTVWRVASSPARAEHVA